MSLPVTKLGLVGAIADTAMAILNSLLKQPRLQLAEVYDPCLALAQSDALHLDASYSPSLDGLLRRSQGIVIGDVRWLGLEPVLRAAEMGRPVLILQPVLADLGRDELIRIQAAAQEARILIMPELSFRWARSTLRLRELTATQAGAIELLEVNCLAENGDLASLLTYDWCCNVMQSECRSVMFDRETERATLSFRRLNRAGASVTAVIQFTRPQPIPVTESPVSAPKQGEGTAVETTSNPSQNLHREFSILEAKMHCRHGQIRLAGEEKLDWEIDRRKVSESLQSDRRSSDVMFDLFGRRLVGGIVPIPEIADLIKSHNILAACLASQESGMEVMIEQS